MYVTVKFVNQPKSPDAKYGNIKTDQDQTIMVPVQNLGLFQRGMTCEIPTENRTWGSGAEARPVTIAVGPPGRPGVAGGPVQNNTAPDPYRGTQYAAPAPGGFQGPPQAAYGGPPGQGNVVQLAPPPVQARPAELPRGNPEARSIFATGVVGRALGSGHFEASAIDMLLQEALRAYDKHLGPQLPAAGGMPNDEIPF